MARWNVRAQVIDTGVVEMGSEFVIHNGVKVVMPDGKRRFLGRVIMHNEVDSLFRETQGEFVRLYFSGRGEGHMALLYGLKTNHEDAYRKESPFAPTKVALVLAGLCGLPLCLLLVGFPLVAVCWLVFMHYRRWDPPTRAILDKHASKIASSSAPSCPHPLVRQAVRLGRDRIWQPSILALGTSQTNAGAGRECRPPPSPHADGSRDMPLAVLSHQDRRARGA